MSPLKDFTFFNIIMFRIKLLNTGWIVSVQFKIYFLHSVEQLNPPGSNIASGPH